MDQIRLGATGLRVSRVCLGMMSYGNDCDRPWVLDEDAAEPIVRAAVEGGVTFFDTADMYSGGASEVATGRLLPKYLARDEVVVATKVFMPMTPGPERPRPVAQAHPVGASTRRCERLGMDYVDLYQIHRWDPHTPIEETMEALHDVVRAGQGALHRREQHVRLAVREGPARRRRHGWTRFVSMQNHYNLVYREEEREMIPLCIDQGVGVIPWSPLARGVLPATAPARASAAPRARRPTSSPTTSTTQPTDFDVVDRVAEVAAERGVAAGAGRARLAAAQARRHRADRRRDEARPPRGRARRRGARRWTTRRCARSRSPTSPTPCSAMGEVRPGWRGRFYEDFAVGDVYEHPLGRTVTDADNIWFTLLTQNTAPIHFDHHYAAQTEFGRPLVDSTFTLALVTGQSVTDVSQNVMANLGWDEVRLPHPVFEGDTIYSRSEVLSLRESRSRPNVGMVDGAHDRLQPGGHGRHHVPPDAARLQARARAADPAAGAGPVT